MSTIRSSYFSHAWSESSSNRFRWRLLPDRHSEVRYQGLGLPRLPRAGVPPLLPTPRVRLSQLAFVVIRLAPLQDAFIEVGAGSG